jgi:ribonuclease III
VNDEPVLAIEPDEELTATELENEQQARMDRCEHRLGYRFKNRALLREALTHASGAQHRLASNERLEFLGDAILGAVVCELLFEQYPEYLEGDLTKIKSAVVSRQSCAKISEALGLQEFLIVGKGMAASPSIPPSLLADVFESLVAAIYLDGGNDASQRFIQQYLGPEIELAAAGDMGGNYKSLLQQLAQREFSNSPRSTFCWTKRDPTIASASRSRLRSAVTVIRRLGDATRRKPNNEPPATRLPRSTANRLSSSATEFRSSSFRSRESSHPIRSSGDRTHSILPPRTARRTESCRPFPQAGCRAKELRRRLAGRYCLPFTASTENLTCRVRCSCRRQTADGRIPTLWRA